MNRKLRILFLSFLLVTVFATTVSAKTWPAQVDVDPLKDWTINFSAPVDASSVISGNVWVDWAITYISVSPDKKSVKVGHPTGGYEPGKAYTLHVNTAVKNSTGASLKEANSLTFTIKQNDNSAAFTVGSTNYTYQGFVRQMETPPVLSSGHIYLPTKYLGLVLGISENDIAWNANTKAVSITKGGKTVWFQIGSNVMYVNDVKLVTDTVPFMSNGYVYIPALYTARSFGYITQQTSNSIAISKQQDTDPPATPTGFNVTAAEGKFTISWDANNETDLLGYIIRYRSSSGTRWNLVENNMGGNPLTHGTITLSGVPSNETCYFFLTATDIYGNESIPTNTLSATTPYVIVPPLYLWSDDGKNVFLGKLTSNTFDQDGIFNTAGSYGSRDLSSSIWSQSSKYGNSSMYGAFDNNATNPPIIRDAAGVIVGRVTTNASINGGISPFNLKYTLQTMGL